jgi:hypothetical protein
VKRYNPELRKRSIEGKVARQQEFDNFVGKLKEQSRSDKPSKYSLSSTNAKAVAAHKNAVWFVQAEEAQREKEERARGISRQSDEARARKEEMRRSAGLSPTVKARQALREER